MADKVKELVNNITKGKVSELLPPKIESSIRLTSEQDSEKEKEFSVQPIKEGGVDPKFAAHQAHPGPAVPKDFNAQEEGTKEERRAKAEALNK